MLRWVIATSLKFRFIVMAIAAALMVFGAGQLRHMPVDVFPEFAPPRVEIQTIALGLSSSEVESLVTIPLEEVLAGTPELDVIRSKSVPQLSAIELIFDPGADLLEARQLVQERLASVGPTLPTWAAPPFMMQPLSATSRVMKIGLSSEDLSLTDMSLLAYWKMRSSILRVPGVANVTIWGERLQQLHVQLDAERLREQGVSITQVMDVTADALEAGLLKFIEGSVIGTGGFVDTPNQRLGVQLLDPIRGPDDLAGIPLTADDGSLVRLDDVADIVWDHQPLIGDAVINDGPGLMLIVEKLPWANTLDVTYGVEEVLDEIGPGLQGMEIDAEIFRPATFVETAISNLSNALIIGALLMVLMLFVFLYEWRTAVISVVAIPLSLVSAGLVLYWRGATVNTMVLAGLVIALGDIVDDAIIDIENVVRRLRQSRKAQSSVSTARVILKASLEVRSAIVYATLLEVVAVVPVLFMEGLSGSFFRPLAITYALALLVSMAVALTVTPAMALIMLRNAPLSDKGSPVQTYLQRGYERFLTPIVRRPRAAFAGVGVLVLAGVSVLPFLGQSLLPSFKERDFLMHWLTKPGTSHAEEVRITAAASRELREIPGVRNFGAHIGQAFLADEVVGMYFGENWISVDPEADYDQTLERVQEVVDSYPGVRRDVLTYLRERIKEVLTGTSESIVIRIFGPDLDTLSTKAEEIKGLLSEIDGVVEEHVEPQELVPQIEIEVDVATAHGYGVKPGDVRRTVAAMLASEEVGDLYRDGKAYDVHVFGTPEARGTVDQLRDPHLPGSIDLIRDLPIDTADGDQVPLATLADVRIAPIPNVIHREAVSRSLDVGANVRGRDLGSVVRELEGKLAGTEFPLEYRAELLGEFSERQAASRRLFVYSIAAAVGVFLLLTTSFRSARLGTLAFLTLPMALVGGMLAAFMGGGILSLGSLVGFLTVLGIVARNGIMLISHYQHLEDEEGQSFGPDLVLRGAKERLTPILMTVATTGLALVPLVATGDIPGQEIEYPMAVVILGGLVTSTLLNLFVVPSLYLRFAKPAGRR